MAIVKSSWTSASSFELAAAPFENAPAIADAIVLAQRAYYNALTSGFSGFDTESPTYVAGMLNNGDRVEEWGSKLNSLAPSVTRLEYTFQDTPYKAILTGAVTAKFSAGGVTPAGTITGMKVVDTQGRWQVSMTGADNVAVADDARMSRLEIASLDDAGNVVASLTYLGAFTASDSNGQVSGKVTALIFSANGQTINASGSWLWSDIATLDSTTNNATAFLSGLLNGADSITGGDGGEELSGFGGDDRLAGGSGDDRFLAESGNDTYDGGSGTDTLVLEGAAADYSFSIPSATTLRITGHERSLSVSNVEQVVFTDAPNVVRLLNRDGERDLLAMAGSQQADILTGTDLANTLDALGGDDQLFGQGGDDVLEGGAGNDLLDGGSGADQLRGGTGNDTYVVDNAGDVVTELDKSGNDTVNTDLASYTLSDNLENLSYTGAAAFTGTGNALANRIVGGEGADTLSGGEGGDTLLGGAGDDLLDGGKGADRLEGGEGNDTYVVDSAGDIVKDTGGDADLVRIQGDTVATYVMTEGIENLIHEGSKAITVTGNALNNRIEGSTLSDTLKGGAGDDVLIGNAGDDKLLGGDGDDHFLEELGNDSYDGGAGVDTLYLAGSADDYGFSLPTASGVKITGLGRTLTVTGVEQVVFAADPAAIRLLNRDGARDLLAMAGSQQADVLTGDDKSNVLNGEGGDDLLSGGAGNDVLNGGAGNDTLEGGSGADVMTGGAGNDIYFVDDTGDQVLELSGGGNDWIKTSLASYTLESNPQVEALSFTGDGAFTGTGNDLANRLSGGAGDDILNGGRGADRMEGGLGNDTYFVDNAGDVVRDEGGEADTVKLIGDAVTSYSLGEGIENLIYLGSKAITVTGNALGNRIEGGTLNDTLKGGLGDDVLVGGAGNDILIGGDGDDVAEFSGSWSQYAVAKSGTSYVIQGADGKDTLTGIERVRFGDGSSFAIEALLPDGGVDIGGGNGNQTLPYSLPDYLLPGLIEDSSVRWNSNAALGTAVTLSYSFMNQVPFYAKVDDAQGFKPMTDTQKTAVREALAAIAETTNVTFVEVSDLGSGGQLRFGTNFQAGSAGYAYYPSRFSSLGGDVFLANNQDSNTDFTPGSYGWATVIHEIGHALGLKHPHEAPVLPTAVDSERYTIMSYEHPADSYVVQVSGTAQAYSYTAFEWSAESLMTYDIAALQYLYGANSNGNGGADSYSLPTDRPFFKTLWDGGGLDTLDCSNQTRACAIDLTPGSYSSIGMLSTAYDLLPAFYSGTYVPTYLGHDNLGIAYGTVIENAVGGSKDDHLTGNGVANTLDGGNGNDWLFGGAGRDVFRFSTLLSTTDNVDRIADFTTGTDRIALDMSVFMSLQVGSLSGDAFYAAAGATAAQDAGDRIIYDTQSGALYFDQDGVGGMEAIKFAVLDNHASLTVKDFLLI
jgi:Ca2+-binding RTX toxin-like protein